MKYQDQKIKAIGRLTIAATVLTVLLACSLVYPGQMRSFVQHLPLYRDGDEYIWLGVLVTMVPIFWAVDLGLIFTSPEQEVRFVAWSRRWRKTKIDFETINFHKLDPDYHKAAWRYFLERYRD
jgi:hypothetical protein